MPDPFTIPIFVPDGDPEGVRLIDRMNWTGLGVAFPRSRWMEVRQRSEFTPVSCLGGSGSLLEKFVPSDDLRVAPIFDLQPTGALAFEVRAAFPLRDNSLQIAFARQPEQVFATGVDVIDIKQTGFALRDDPAQHLL